VQEKKKKKKKKENYGIFMKNETEQKARKRKIINNAAGFKYEKQKRSKSIEN
jgi:hypothetical protein